MRKRNLGFVNNGTSAACGIAPELGEKPLFAVDGGFFNRLCVGKSSVIDNHHRREGSGVVLISIFICEVQPPAYKSDFRLSVYVIVKIYRIGTSRDQQNNGRPMLRFLIGFANPLAGFPSIRRIAEYCPPRLHDCFNPSVSGVKKF